MLHVEVEFTIRHSIDELRDKFIRQGRFPGWRAQEARVSDGTTKLAFLETRVIGVELRNEKERSAWWVFSMEACGELKDRIVIPITISSALNLDNLELESFLHLCRECLVDSHEFGEYMTAQRPQSS